jgi:predicted nucleic acid-binding protein
LRSFVVRLGGLLRTDFAIVAAHKVQGVKVYDARLAAIMSVYAVESILTFNSADFERFTNVRAIHPSSLVP